MHSIVMLFAIAFCLGGEPFFDGDRTYPGARDVSFRLSGSEVANGHTLLLECIAKVSENARDSGVTRSDAGSADPAQITDLVVVRGDRSHRLYAHPTEFDGFLFTLIGIPYRAAPGPDTLYVEWTESDRIFYRELPFSVVTGPYRSERIRGVPQNRVTPSPADYRRIERERTVIAKAYEAVRDTTMMGDTFSYPVEKKTITSPYGTRRVFNGQLRSYHGGLDMRAYEGTPIYAAQSGVVKLAQNLFYSGNHVLVEHGMGIHTGYSHMSRLYVKTGDQVTQGQLLGLSGSTGRVTAAHLHWTVNVHGVGVSPLQFTEVLAMLYKKPVEVRNPNDG